MGADQAERWVVISAALVAAIYAYRRVIEPGTTQPATLKAVAGQSAPPVSAGAFVTAWGATFLIVSIIATAAPGLGGAFALLIAAGDFLANAPNIFNDIGQHTTSTPSAGDFGGGGTFANAGGRRVGNSVQTTANAHGTVTL